MWAKRFLLAAATKTPGRRLVLASAVLSCAQMMPSAYADTAATWNGTIGNWSDFTKWSTNPNYPNNGTPASVLYDVTINAGTVTLDVSPTIQTLNLNGGTIGTGNLTVLGAFTVASGTLSSVALTGNILLSTTSASLLVTGTTSFGTAHLSANNAMLNMAPGYTLNNTVQADGAATGARIINLASGATGTVTFGSAGVVRLAAGSGSGLTIQNSSAATLVNNGLISAEAAGEVLLISNSTLSNTSTGILQVTAGTLALNATNWTNAGTINGTGGIIDLGGTFNATAGIGTFTTSAATVNITGTITNTGNTIALNATTGSWNFLGGTINNGSVNETGGATLTGTSSGGTLSNVAVTGDLLLNATSASLLVIGTTSFATAHLAANNVNLGMAPGYTLNNTVQSEGTAAGTRLISLAQGGTGTVTFGSSGVVRLAAGSGAGLTIQNSSVATLVNNGLISAEAAGEVLTINNTTLTNASTGILQATAGTLALNATNWTNAGTINGTGGTIDLGGTFNATGGIGTFTTSAATVNVTGTITNTGNTITLNATTGSWNLFGGTINNGSINETGATLMATTSGGALSNVAVTGDLTFGATSAVMLVSGTTSFGTAHLQANNAILEIAPGYTLNNTVQTEGIPSGARLISLAQGGTGTVTVGTSGVVRLASGAGGGLTIQNSSVATLVNNGLISAEAAGEILTINNTTLTNASTGILQVTAGTLALNATNWTNAGTIHGTGGNIDLGGTFNATGGIGTFTTAAATVNVTGTITNTGNIITLNATTGSWNMLGGTINNGSINEAGALLVPTTSTGTLANVAVTGDLTFNTTSAALLLSGTTTFGIAHLQANNTSLEMAPGYTLNNTVQAEGTAAGARVISLAVGGSGTVTVASSGIVRLAAGSGGGLTLSNSSAATLINNGLISAEASGQALSIQNSIFTNNATTQVTAGTLSLTATNWTNSGTITATTASTLTFGGSWSDAGILSINNATLNLGGTFSTSGINFAGFTRTAGTVNLTGTLTNTGSTLTLDANAGSWNLMGGTINNGSVNETVGTLVGTTSGGTLSSVAVTGDLILNTTSAFMLLTGTTTFGTARLQANNAGIQMAPGYTLNNTIQAEGAAAGARVITLAVGGTGTVTIASSGVVRLAAGAGSGVSISNSSAGTLVNNGLISAEATGEILTIQNSTLTNNSTGTLQVKAGTLNIIPTNWTNAGTITGTGGIIDLGGTFNATGGIGTFTTSAVTVNVTGTITNTGNTITLNATTGPWNMLGGTINNGSINEAGAALVPTTSVGTLSNVTVNGDLSFAVTSDVLLVTGTTTFGTAHLQANNAGLEMPPGYTLNNTVQAEGTAAGARVITLAVGGTGTVTVGSSGIIRLAAGAGAGLTLSNSSAATLVNNGLITAEATAQTLLFNNTTVTNNATIQVIAAGLININPTNFTNNGLLQATNGGTLTVTPIPTNFSSGTLTGGTWDAFANSTLNLAGLTSNITTNAASVTLSGTGSVFTRLTNGLATNNGSLFLLAGRSFTAVGALTNNGLLDLGGGTLSATTLANGSTGTLQGFGAVSLRLTNSGLVEATAGTLTFSDGINGGTIQTDATGILSLTGGVSGTTGSSLINNGSLTLGNNNVSITGSYTNANFGTGNAFNKHANVSTTGGQILAVGGNTQTLTGNVANGATSTPTIAFNNVHVGDVVNDSYQINNTGATGPSVLYALQTSVGGGAITDSRLSGTGISSSNVGPVAIGAASPSLGVTLTASSDGPLTGQTLHIANNFDNITEQTLSITGTAYNYAAPVVSGNPVNFGNVHVNATVAPVAYTLKNNAPNDGFAEALDNSLTGASGNITIAGSVPQLAPQASSTALTATLNTSSAGAQSGSVTLNLTSDGAGSSGLPNTTLTPVTLTASGAVYNLAAPALANSTVNFGSVHVGDVVAPLAYSLKNNAASGGFSEALDGGLSGASGNIVIGGSVPLLPAQSTSTAITATLDTSTPGVKSGSATLTFTSDGTSTSGLPSTPLSSVGLTASATVYNYAVAALQKNSGSGSFTVTDATHATLDFGILNTGNPVSANLSILNTATGLADTLAGSWTLSAPDFSFTNFTPFTNIAAGGSLAGLQVNLTAGASGLYTETATLHPLSQDSAPFSGALPDYTLTLKVEVNPLEATWNGGTGNWSNGTQWTTTPVAPNNGVPTNAQYDATISTGAVTLDEDISIRAVTISGGSLGNAAHSLTLSSGLTLSGGTFNLSATGSLSAGTLTVAAGGTFAQTGGTLAISSSLTQSGGSISLGGSQTLYGIPTVSLTGGTTALAASAKKVLVTSSLTLSGTAQLDVTEGDLILHSTVGNLAADDTRLQGYLNAGEIRSSLSSSLTGVGLMRGSDYLLLQGAAATFAGQAVASTDLLVRYTYLGDANFDGKITLADYAQIDAGFLLGAFNGVTRVAQWMNGDFNGDGVVNYKDYALIDAAYVGQSGPLADGEITKHEAAFGEPYVTALDAALNQQTGDGAVPEPGSLLLLTLGGTALLRRNRR